MFDDTEPMPTLASDLRRLRRMDDTIASWRRQVAHDQARLAEHLSAKERFLADRAPSPTYYEPATHPEGRLF